MSWPKETMMECLCERIGGKAPVGAAADLFYERVLSDDRIKPFFDDVDMKNQIGKQRALLTMSFGGPTNYTGKDVRAGHQHLVLRGLNDGHFDAVMEHLGGVLTDLNVPADLIGEAAAIAESVRHDVLSRASEQRKAA